MRIRLLVCLAVLAASCIKRIAPSPGDARTTLSGVWLRFGQAQELPEGTEITWDFGDGTSPQTGAMVLHAFPRAAVYTVVETVRDKDGESRSARTHVAVLKRQLQMAVPADVRAALLVPSPWAKARVHREVAAKLSLGAFFDEVARTVSDAAGFDALDPKAADANGIDPDEGVAFYTVPQDPEALVLAVGTSDDEKSLAAAKRLLSYPRGIGRFGAGPFQVAEAKLPDGTAIWLGQNASGDKIGLLQKYGYLYLRTAGATDPALALASTAALPPDKGLSADKGFVTAMRHVGNGDAIFYSRGAEGAAAEGRFSHQVGVSAFTVLDPVDQRTGRPELLQLRMYAQLRTLGGKDLVAAFTPAKAPADLASKLPAGAAAYLRISASPQTLWRELTRTAGADAARLRDRVQEAMGLDLEKDLIPSFAGNIGIGVYLDASSLIEAILGEQVGSFDRSAFMVAAELADPATVQAALDRAMKSRPAGDRAQLNGAPVFRLGDGALASIKDGVLFLAIGGGPQSQSGDEQPPPRKGRKKSPEKKPLSAADLTVLARVLAPDAGTLTLSQQFKRIGVAGFDQAGQQNVWVDIAGIVRSIERAGAEQGGVARQGSRLFAERAADLRDALFEARPSAEGVDADLWLRFLPHRNASR